MSIGSGIAAAVGAAVKQAGASVSQQVATQTPAQKAAMTAATAAQAAAAPKSGGIVTDWVKSAAGKAATINLISGSAAQTEKILTAPFVTVEHPELAIDRTTRTYWILGSVALTAGVVVLATASLRRAFA